MVLRDFIRLGLLQLDPNVVPGTGLLVVVGLDALGLVLEVAVLLEEGDSLLGFIIANPLLFVQRGNQRDFLLEKKICRIVELLQLSEQITVLGG